VKIPDRVDVVDSEQLLLELADILAMAKPSDKESLLLRLLSSEAYSVLNDSVANITRRLLG
jgi:hypothetical protein